ncbi:MAG: TIGR02147 family protein, partial [Fibrobacterales bacterium]
MNIFGYYNYRSYLKDYYEYRKSKEPSFSYRIFVQQAGLRSSGIYLDIVRGRRRLTLNSLLSFSKAMKLEEKEIKYFTLMMHFTDATTHEAKQDVFEEMSAMLPRVARKITRAQRAYYENWYVIAIREALSVINIDVNYQDLAYFLNPRVSVSKVKHSMNLLEELDLIEKRDGFWRSKNGRIEGDHIDAFTMHNLQKQFIDLSKESLTAFTKEKRNISGTSMSISESGIARMIHKIDTFRSEAHDLI